MSAGSILCARRRTESQVGSVLVFDADRIESRLGAAAGMVAIGDSVGKWSAENTSYLQEMRGRSALLVDVGADAQLLRSMREDDQD